MALPWIFINAATISSVWWDDDFAALGALTPIPCSVTGTDALLLTPLTDTPTIPAYANYGIFTGIVQADNTGPATAQAGALAALTIYKDTGAGPVVLAAGDLKAGNTMMIYVTWARNHPEHLGKSRGLTVDASLRAAYPCGQATPRTSSAPSFLRQ